MEVIAKRPNPLAGYVWDLLREPYGWPGGYGRALVLEDGELLCHHCTGANAEEVVYSAGGDGWAPVGIQGLEWLDGCETCAHCGDCLAHPVGLGRPGVDSSAVCGDCLSYLANGDLPADRAQIGLMRLADLREAGSAWEPWGYVGECEYVSEGCFSWSPCAYCRRPEAAGSRWPVVIVYLDE